MPRGIVPRQPAKTGRQEGARVARTLLSAKTAGRLTAIGRPPVPTSRPTKGVRANDSKRYDPLAPERIAEILKRLDQLYPDVTCALHHKSAWELLVATILSAQSTDVNVNRVTPELFRKYPTVRGFCRAYAGAAAARYSFHRLFPQQIQIGGGRGEEDRQ